MMLVWREKCVMSWDDRSVMVLFPVILSSGPGAACGLTVLCSVNILVPATGASTSQSVLCPL